MQIKLTIEFVAGGKKRQQTKTVKDPTLAQFAMAMGYYSQAELVEASDGKLKQGIVSRMFRGHQEYQKARTLMGKLLAPTLKGVERDRVIVTLIDNSRAAIEKERARG